MVAARGGPLWAAAALLLAAAVEAARVNRITPRHVGFAGGEIAILGSDFAEDQYSQFQPELGNIVNFVNDWDTVPCKVNVYKTSSSRIICTVGPLRADRGLGNWYTLRLTVDGQPVSSGWSIQFHDGYTPRVESVEPVAGPPGSLITITGRFFTDRYSIDTKTASDLQDNGVSIAWIRVGSEDCDPVDPSTGELYGLTSTTITCRTSVSYAGPLSVQLMVTGRGLSEVKERRHQISAQDSTYDFLAVPEVTGVQPSTLAARGGAIVTVNGVGFGSQPRTTDVMIGGAECRVLTVTPTQLTCAAPPDLDTSAQKQGGSGVKYEVWLDAEVADLGDLSSLTPESDGYNSETLYGASVTNNTFGQGAAAGDKFVGRLSGWLRSPRLGQFVLTLRSDGPGQLRLGTDRDNMEESPVAETDGNFDSVQKSALINMTHGQFVYFEATHKEAGDGGYRLQLGLIDYNSPVTPDQAQAANQDSQVLYIKGQLRQEQQVLTFENVPAEIMTEVALEFNGIRSQKKLNVDTATEDDWRSAVLDMFSAQCEYSRVDQAWMRTYEPRSDSSSLAETGRETGVRKNETVEPWCGAWSLYKPWGAIWTATDADVHLPRHRWLCLAHWGRISGQVKVLLQFRDNENRFVQRWRQFDAELPSLQSWTYSCVDLVDKLGDEISLPATLKDVRLPFSWSDDVYFDDVSFSAEEKTLLSRRPAARLGADPLFVREARVTRSADPLTVAVTLRVARCAANLPLIQLAGTNGTQVADTSMLDELVMSASDWGQGSVTNVRNVSASPAPAATWDITFNGKTIGGVPTNLTSEGMTLLLATQLSLPGLVVHRHGECNAYHWNVQFRHHGGRQPPIVVNGSDVHFDGYNLQVGVWKNPTNGDGRVTHEFLPADLTRLPRSEAGVQVDVTVAGVTSRCVGNCDVTYDPALNAEVSSVAAEIDETSGDATLTVGGTNLGTAAENVRVALTGVTASRDCVVTSATGTEVTCTARNLQAGRYEVTLTVTDQGQAAGSAAVHVSPLLTSVTPAEGSPRGGTVISLRGRRLPHTAAGWQEGAISVGGAYCSVINSTSTATSCRVLGTVGDAGTAVSVVATFGDQSSTLEAAFTPLADNAVITAVNVSTSGAAGGGVLGITGTGFGRLHANQSVTVGGASCDVTRWRDTEISCRLPPLGHGQHAVEVNRGQLGLADNSAVAPISYTFSVSDVSPRLVSAAGGAVVRVRGQGLAADCDQLEVTAGDGLTCDLLTCTDTEVTCRLRRRRRRHVIRNNATHPRYGPGYLWQPQKLSVSPGDLVTWSWAPGQVSSGSVGFAVHQTADQHSDEYDQTGFNSGDKTERGSFTTMMEDIGTIFYSGPPVGSNTLRMRGVIDVVAPSENDTVIKVKIGMVEAVLAPPETTVPAFEPTDLCSTDSLPGACPTPESSVTLLLSHCVTPRITGITVTGGSQSDLLTEGSELVVSGTGFSTTACHNRITLGSGSCDVTAATANELTCRVTAAGLPHGGTVPIALTVANRGAAIIEAPAASKHFRSEPTVSGVSPASGSPTGGTLLTITGSSLTPVTTGTPPRVQVGTADCPIQSATLSQLTCRTPAGADTLPVKLLWQDETGQTRTLENMTFTYDATKTPTLTSAQLSADGQRTLTLAGDKLGADATNLVIRLIPRATSRRRRRQVEAPPPTDASDAVMNQASLTDRSADVISLDPDTVDVDPAMDLARREDAAFWNRFSGGRSSSFGEFVSSGQLRAAGSGAVTAARVSPAAAPPGTEQDYLELTPEYVSDFHEATQGRRRGRRRVHLRRRQRRSAGDPEELTCESVTITDGGATCQLPESLSGEFDVQLVVGDLGAAADTVALDVAPTVSTDSLAPGSVHGGARIQLVGAGFGSDTSVTIGGQMCEMTALTATALQCLTPPGEGAQPVVVASGGLTADGPQYTYSVDSTPVITSASSEDNAEVSIVSGTGTGLGTAAGTYLTVSGRRCDITSLTDSQFSCELTSHLAGGQHPITLYAPEGTGNSAPFNIDVTLAVTSVSPNSAGLGGTTLTIAGGKFDTADPITVTVCDEQCPVTSVTATQITCIGPAVTAAPATACDVLLTMTGGDSVASEAAFTYDASLTSSVTSVTPVKGGTAGGTTITIAGTGFAETGNAVTIDGVTCDVTSESVTQVVCVTNGHSGPGQFPVTVDVPGVGFAEVGAADVFQYVDRWSSPFTWGGSDPPSDGQSVSITAGQTILLDTSTPVLRLILIDGGELIFDPDAPFLELNAEYIVVVGGGKVQIGTEESPHLGQAAITLHGNVRATELPVYGAKVLAVRNGTLDLHGRPLDITWTYLGSTAAAGDSSITLDRAVGWAIGDEIVIASTGDKRSMGESEKHVIGAVSEDGLTLTLESPLAFEHISSEQTFAGQTVRMRAEVGLLTRNVKVRGSVNDEFTEKVQACAAGFNPGQFDVQTCFHGRYGAETVSDQFGATVMIHAKFQNQHLVTGRIEYVEVTEAGQAFRLGRYPIHYHLNGNVTGSYVRGCAIHRTYNRAVTIHAVDYLLVEHNVAYDNMGHAFFTEDGIESYNTIQYNLAIFTRTSSSLLNVDVTPASYWVVNPTNIVRHNAAAGGTHFGFWYRTEEHPSGPSFTDSYCPNHAPMGEFFNNTAHSFGRYGLWVFSMDGYFPLSGGEDTCSGQEDVARFGQFLAWHCERGAEVVLGGSLRFENFTVVDNEMSGLEMVKVKGPFGPDGPGVQNALVVGHSALAADDACTERGIITPKQYIFNVDGATFVNFDRECTALGGCSQCKPLQGGFHHQFRRIVYDNSPNKMKWKWTHESVFHDTDGSLSGEEDGVVLPWTDILPPDRCTKGLSGFDVNSEVPTAVCDSSVSIHRMAFNQPTPSSLLYKTVNFTTQHGTTSSFWMKKRLTHGKGWMALLVGGETHRMEFADSNQLTNISYVADFYFLRPEDRLAVSHAMLQRPDRLQAGGAPSNGSGPPLDLAAGTHGDVHWDNDTYIMSYLVAGQSRARRAAGPFEDRDAGRSQRVELTVERCFFDGCQPPPAPTVPTGRPDQVQLWSQATEDVWTVPEQMQDVTIPADLWVLVDVALPPIRRLIIYGVLEIGDDMDNVLNCTHIVVHGKLVAGTAEQPFQNRLTILLRGRHRVGADAATADIPMPYGTPNIGWKALATFGALELHGRPRSVQWTSLAAPADAGADSLQLVAPVDWPADAEVVVTTGSFESRQTEVRRVTAISEDGTQLTLNDTLQHAHLATDLALPGGVTKRMAAKVGLLSRNIRIEGESYDDVIEESFGARVLASSYYDENNIKKTASVHLSNVEFRLAGQDGWSDSYDPRFALALHSLDDTDATVVNCSFNHLFSPAVGIFYSNNVTVEGSVIMHTVGSGIIDEGSRNRLQNNLVSWLVFPGTYNGRDEPENLSWDAAFRVDKASDLTLIGNVVAGSERIGFHIGGTDCSVQSSWADNEAHGVLHGVHMFSRIRQEQCAKVSGFYVWRAWDFGIYFDVPSQSVVVEGNVLVENTMAILPMMYEPDPLAHKYADKQVNITSTVVVAVAAAEHCAADAAPAVAAFRTQARAPRASGGGRTGIVWGQFLSRKVGAPQKPWHNPMSYPAVRGNTFLSGVQLVNFNRLCGGQRDIAISTLGGGDDAQHPVIIDTVTFTNVNSDDRLFLHRPNLGRVNPSDCVDMDCDGHKHAMMIDTDGSIIGSSGTVVPQAEFEFDGDQRRGVGYYRVPESAVTRLDGSRLPYADKMPNKGIWRTSDCTWQEPWNAYSCPGGQQRMLVIESMDPDTEVRRVSPIALVADPGASGFVDLLNGPQDMGWCFGYTCQERISTFYSVVSPGRVYEMHFTGTPPQHLRFHFLNANADQAILMKIWYPKTQRYDVSYEGEFVYPSNTDPETFNVIPSDNPEEFVPLVTSTKHGENYFSRTDGFLYVLIRGPGVVEIQQQPVIVLKMGFVSEGDFFETDVLNRMADLLDIDASQLRVANIVREDSARRRRRREVSKTEVEFEIGASPATNTSTNSSTAMSVPELQQTQSKVVDEFQSGTMDEALGVTVDSMQMVDPEPPATDPTNGVRATNATGGEDLSGVEGAKTYSEQQREQEQEEAAAEAAAAAGVTYERPSEMALDSAAVSGSIQELTMLTPLIKLYMKDDNGERMSAVGHESNPWQVQAELVSPPSGLSLLNSRVPFEAGVATFSRLMVSGVGSGLKLRFRVVHPSDADFSVDMAGSFETEKKQLAVHVAGRLGDAWHSPGERISPGIRVEIRDQATGGLASADSLRGYTWQFRAVLHQYAENTPNAALQGTRVMELPPPSGQSSYDPAVVFNNLMITPAGWHYLINFTVTARDDDSIRLHTLAGPIHVQSEGPSTLPVLHTIGLRMTPSFRTVSGRQLQFSAELVNFLNSRYNSRFTSVALEPGSIKVAADSRDSSESSHQLTVDRMRRDLEDGLTMTDSAGHSYPFDGSLLVDGVYKREKPWVMPAWILALICVMATLLVVGAVVLIWICCCNTVQRGKVQDVNQMAFKVPINAVPPPPFTPGLVSSFNIRMSILDPNQKVAPSIIQVTSDDPLVNMEDMKLDDLSVPSSPLNAGPPVAAAAEPSSDPEPASASEQESAPLSDPASAPSSEPEPETEPNTASEEAEEQRRQREADEAREKAEKEAEKIRADQEEAEAAKQEKEKKEQDDSELMAELLGDDF